MTMHWPGRARRVAWLAGLGCWMLLLWGCTTAAPPPIDIPAPAPAAHFALTGRLSIRDGQRVEIAGIHWSRTSNAEEITIRSPLGSVLARIWQDRDGIAHLKSGDDIRKGTDIDTLAAEALGAVVPLRVLAWWIQGRNAGGGEWAAAEFEHEGWLVSIEALPQSGQLRVARRVTVRKGDLSLRLVIDEWEPRS